MNSKPTLLCWITCDGVHIDPSTGKHTVLGMYSGIAAARYPFTCPYMVWFLSLTGCVAGEHKLKISMGEEQDKLVPLLERPFNSQDPIQHINLINEVSNLQFPRAADYIVKIEVDDQHLLTTGLTLT